MNERRPRWAVVGGGLLGLTLALRLRAQGRAVTVIEGASELGGLASAWQIGDVRWDRHYHVTLFSDAATRALLAELGLESEMRWAETRTGAFADGRLHSVSNVLELLRFPALSTVDVLRLGATVAAAARMRRWERLETIPVETWCRRWSGDRTTERFWLPLLRSKLGDAYRDTSAAFLWATIQRLQAARRSGLGRDRFGYVPGGYGRVLAVFADRLAKDGVELRLGAPVERVAPDPGGGLRVRAAGVEERFDRVVVTTAAPLAERLCEGLSDDEQARLAGVRMLGVVCASLLLRRPLAGFYVTNLLDAGLPFTGVIEMSALVEPAALGGHHLVYLPRYAEPGDPVFDEPDAALEARFLAGLARIHPALRREDVLAFRVSRVRNVMPIPTLGYSRRVPPLDASVPGLHFASSAQIVNGTLNVNETVGLAERVARRLAELP